METEPISNFKFSQGVLMQTGDKAVSLIDQDEAVLLPYGINAAYKTELQGLTDQYKDFPTDEEMLGKEKHESEVKDAKATTLREATRTMMVKVKQVFPENSGNYSLFGTKGLSEKTDADLVRCGKIVVRMLTEFLPELPNIDQAMIDAYELIVKDFDDSYDEQQYAIRKRRAKTIDRTTVGNKLFARISTLFDYGKDYWSTRNYARYRDYVLYNTPSGQPELSGDVGTASGTAKDKMTLQPVANGMVALEFIGTPVPVDPATGKWQCANVPVECNTVFCMAKDHKLFKGSIKIIKDTDSNLDILMEPGA